MKSNQSRNWSRSNATREGMSRPEDRFPPVDSGARQQIARKADSSISINVGLGLNGGGDLTSDRTIDLDLGSVLIAGAGITITDNGDGTFTISSP